MHLKYFLNLTFFKSKSLELVIYKNSINNATVSFTAFHLICDDNAQELALHLTLGLNSELAASIWRHPFLPLLLGHLWGPLFILSTQPGILPSFRTAREFQFIVRSSSCSVGDESPIADRREMLLNRLINSLIENSIEIKHSRLCNNMVSSHVLEESGKIHILLPKFCKAK